ncbi:hypothetical protein S83_071262, partial [Arachis hypogaea]
KVEVEVWIFLPDFLWELQFLGLQLISLSPSCFSLQRSLCSTCVFPAKLQFSRENRQ